MTLTDTATDAKGLTSDEAARLLAERGPNEAATEQDGLLQRIVRHFWAPVPWMLEIAVIIQIAMREYVAASLIAAVLVFNVLLGTFQESRAKAALELLKQSLPLKARVRRDGNWTDLLARVLVQGDIVQLSLGTVVPADIKIVSGSILVDQSMLTGESVPIEAVAGTVTYAGAQVRRGEAIGLVTATGASTYFGRAAELVRVAHFESSEEKAVFGLVRNLTFLNAAILIWLVTYAPTAAVANRFARPYGLDFCRSGCAAGNVHARRRAGLTRARSQGGFADATDGIERSRDHRCALRRQNGDADQQ